MFGAPFRRGLGDVNLLVGSQCLVYWRCRFGDFGVMGSYTRMCMYMRTHKVLPVLLMFRTRTYVVLLGHDYDAACLKSQGH